MTEVTWHGLRDLLALRAHFDEFFEKALLPTVPAAAGAAGSHEPPIDIWEDDRHLVIEVDLPGVAGSELDLRLEGDDLVLGGTAAAAAPPGCSYLRIERPHSPFHRRVRLPVAVTGHPRATLDGGVLTVTLEREAQARRIPVLYESASR